MNRSCVRVRTRLPSSEGHLDRPLDAASFAQGELLAKEVVARLQRADLAVELAHRVVETFRAPVASSVRPGAGAPDRGCSAFLRRPSRSSGDRRSRSDIPTDSYRRPDPRVVAFGGICKMSER